MFGARTGQCPSCGGPLEFKLGSSPAIICPWCKAQVVRSTEGVTAYGKVADLVPTASPMAVGDTGVIAGKRFRVVGRLQRDQGLGPWDEFFVELETGESVWLARAQGEWHLLREVPGVPALPPRHTIKPGVALALDPGSPPYVVREIASSRVVTADGELPHPIRPGNEVWFVDCQGPSGPGQLPRFATLEFEGDAVTGYAGETYRADQVVIERTGVGPRPEESLASKDLKCTQCGGQLKLVDAERAESIACGYCHAIHDVRKDKALVFVSKQDLVRPPQIPMGTEGTFKGASCMVIGYQRKSVRVDGVTYFFEEYLLYGPAGYAWLVCDQGHFTFVRTISAGDVSSSYNPTYQGRSHRFFSQTVATVEEVIGEFFWRVRRGDQAQLTDYIAPPYVLSREEVRTKNQEETTWSIGEYVSVDEINAAFGTKIYKPSGVGVAQESPIKFGRLLLTFAASFVILIGLALARRVMHSPQVLFESPVRPHLAAPALPTFGAFGEPLGITAPPPPGVDSAEPFYSPSFELRGSPTTLEVFIGSDAMNNIISVDVALVNETTGVVRELSTDLENYRGYTDGENWSEGSGSDSVYFGSVGPGTYVLRVEGWSETWAGPGSSASNPAPQLNVRATAHERSIGLFLFCAIMLILPFIFAAFRWWSFEANRWDNATVSNPYRSQSS